MIDLSTVRNEDLMRELESRLKDDKEKHISPYDIMVKMVERGWQEDPRKGHTDPRIAKVWDYVGYPALTDDDSWCAAIMNACLKLAGYEMTKNPSLALSFADYSIEVDLSNAQKGDIVVLNRVDSSWRGHVGFFTAVASEYIESLDQLFITGGNQDNKVKTKKYILNDLDDYELNSIRRIVESDRINGPDYETLKEWRLL